MATSLYEEENRTHHQEEWLLVHRLNQGNCRRECAGPHPCRDTRKPQRGTSTDSGRKPLLALREVNLSFRSVSLCRRVANPLPTSVNTPAKTPPSHKTENPGSPSSGNRAPHPWRSTATPASPVSSAHPQSAAIRSPARADRSSPQSRTSAS